MWDLSGDCIKSCIARVPSFDVSAVLQGLVKSHIDHLLSRS